MVLLNSFLRFKTINWRCISQYKQDFIEFFPRGGLYDEHNFNNRIHSPLAIHRLWFFHFLFLCTQIWFFSLPHYTAVCIVDLFSTLLPHPTVLRKERRTIAREPSMDCAKRHRLEVQRDIISFIGDSIFWQSKLCTLLISYKILCVLLFHELWYFKD